MPYTGIVFLDKPLGWTSRKAVNEVVRLFSQPGQKKIKAGHAGTLDPLATGMLPILLGEATRFAELGLNAEKAYTVTFDLSYQTDTLDCEGETTDSYTGEVSREQLLATLETFHGEIDQIPPAYSAIRIDGKRSHELARQGQDVTQNARKVRIETIELLDFSFPKVSLHIRCSKGTYIRSLARDIGLALGIGGCVTMLRRTSTGGWPEVMMVSFEQLSSDKEHCVLPLRQWLRELPDIELPAAEARRFLQGQRLQLNTELTGSVVVCSEDTVLGTAELMPGMKRMVAHPVRILPSAQRSFLT